MNKRTLLAAGLAASVSARPLGALAAESERKLGYAILGLGYYAMESTDRSDIRFKEVEDIINFQLLFPSGATANCVSAYSANCNRYRVTDPKGWVELEPATNYDGQKMLARLNGQTGPREPAPMAKSQFVGQLDHFAECILAGREPIVSGEEGLKDLRLIEAIYRAAREGRTVKV